MKPCPNCGQTTVRTEDWACQWCGYPLLSKSFKKIPKTYKQLKEEKLYEQKLPVREETEAAVLPSPGTLPPTHTLEPEPEPVLEPEPVAKPKAKSVPKPKPKPAPKPKAKSVPKSKAKPVPKPEPEPVSEPEPESAPTAIEVTVEELLSAYEADAAAADAKFANEILKVTGVVDRIEVKDILDIHYIILTSAEKGILQDIRCTFDKKHGPELNQLTKGQTVTVRGKYDGSIIDICLRDCVLVR